MSRPPIIRASFEGELVVDNFAGGGGASTGMEAALGRGADIAINHSPQAIAMHRANHPNTKHFCENILEVDPKEACGGRPVGLAWFSPDCTHFSRAKGGRPVKKEIRGLAWVVVRWAREVRPRVIILENVEEFQTWGPLNADNRPDPKRAGETFQQWCGQLTDLGYTVDFKSLIAADFGTPTTRKRLFMIARRDGQAVAWPGASHGAGAPNDWVPASEIVDWSLPCPSIFERKKPLADKTLKRIAAGIQRYVIDAADPFIIPVTHQGGYNRGHDIQLPLPTVTGAHRGEFALVSPTLIQTGYGERPGQAPRVPGLHKPLGTVVAGGSKHALVGAFLSRYFGQSIGQSVNRPAPTVTPGGQGKTALTCACLTKFYGTSRVGASVENPLPTITAGAGGGHMGAVQAFLVKYYSSGSHNHQSAQLPLHTVTTKARFGIVIVHGEPYVITDIGMRMLQPHELFAAQGFPRDYIIRPRFQGKPMTKTAQIMLAGNAVPPQPVEALVRENAA